MSTGNPSSEGGLAKKEKRVLRVDQVWSKKKRQHYFVPTSKKTQAHRSNKYPLVVRRVITQKGLLAGTEVDIHSTRLSDLLIKILDGVPGLELTKEPPTLGPRALFSARPELEVRLAKEQQNQSPDEELIEDIQLALSFLDKDFGTVSASLNRLMTYGDITYDLLWAIFVPGMEIFTKESHFSEPQLARYCSGEYKETQQGNFYRVIYKMISHDGESLGWSHEAAMKIDEFQGTSKIRELAVYPFKFHTDQDAMRRMLVERGRTFIRLLKPKCFVQEYHGTAVYQDMDIDERPVMQFTATGRIMVDPVSYRNHNPNCVKILRPWVPSQKPSFPDHELVFCNCGVLGFSFADKRWGSFAVSRMCDVEWDPHAFDKLILAPKKRDIIRSLVQSHRTDASVFDDIVIGKGKGLVGLLSGSPGVGKTLTAEVVAEASQRTLYRVTAGELGTTSTSVDKQLGMVLGFGARWNCVILLDEADVFLYKRGDADLQRNALCSIFLRRLEYFQGILILTTNRRKDIDEAFKSRIHFSFHYPELQKADRMEIWKTFLKGSDNIKSIDLSDSELSELSEKPINGREIKNVVSCAASIVRAEESTLTMGHLKDVLELLIDDWDESRIATNR